MLLGASPPVSGLAPFDGSQGLALSRWLSGSQGLALPKRVRKNSMENFQKSTMIDARVSLEPGGTGRLSNRRPEH